MIRYILVCFLLVLAMPFLAQAQEMDFSSMSFDELKNFDNNSGNNTCKSYSEIFNRAKSDEKYYDLLKEKITTNKQLYCYGIQGYALLTKLHPEDRQISERLGNALDCSHDKPYGQQKTSDNTNTLYAMIFVEPKLNLPYLSKLNECLISHGTYANREYAAHVVYHMANLAQDSLPYLKLAITKPLLKPNYNARYYGHVCIAAAAAMRQLDAKSAADLFPTVKGDCKGLVNEPYNLLLDEVEATP